MRDMVKGIVISLRKRNPRAKLEKDEKYNYTVFGYYDGMNIKAIEWGRLFHPDMIVKTTNEIDLENDGIDKHVVLACAPEEVTYNKLVEKGFNYKIWVKEQDYTKIEAPFVSCMSIHLSKNAVEEKSFSDLILKIANSLSKEDIPKLNCGIFFAMGYSDIIVLFRTSDFVIVNKAISEILNKSIDDNYTISDFYTITGFDKAFFSDCDMVSKIIEKTNQSGHDDVSQIAASFILRKGISFKQFFKNLQESVSKVYNELGSTFKCDLSKGNLFETFGGSDVVVTFKIPIMLFPLLYKYSDNKGMEIAPFNRKSKFAQDNIVSMKVQVQIASELSTTLAKGDIPELPNYNVPYEYFFTKLNTFLGKHNLPARIYISLLQLIKTYNHMVLSDHGFDIEYVLKHAFDSFIKNVSISMNNLDNKSRTDGYSVHDYDEYSSELSKFMKAINQFRSFVETYISDLSSSDRTFIEGRVLTHPSIGSSAKMLFSYNKFINDLAKRLDNIEDAENSGKFSFIVVSGGCDRTEIHEIFSYIGAWKSEYAHLYVITIPEASIFDIGGTLFRLSHECFHCVGNRQRVIRAQYAYMAAAKYVADEFSKVLFKKEFFWDMGSIFKSKDGIPHEIQSCIDKERDDFKTEFYNALITDCGDIENWDEKDLYSECCVDELAQVMSLNFIRHSNTISEFYLKMFNELLRRCKNILSKSILEMYTHGGLVGAYEDLWSDISLIQSKQNLQEPEASNFSDIYIKQQITYYYDDLFSYFVARDKLRIAEAMEPIPDNKKLTQHISYDHREIIYLVIDAMCECYADCNAIKLLGVELSDFLLSFIYEIKNVDFAMQDSILNSLRIGADLSVAYGKHELELCDIQIIKERAEGMSISENSINNYIERIKVLLEEYNSKYRYLGEYIEGYINQCNLENPFDEENDECKNILKQYKDLYSGTNIEITTNKLYSILSLWKEMARDDKEE